MSTKKRQESPRPPKSKKSVSKPKPPVPSTPDKASTPSTPSTQKKVVEAVEGVEGTSRRAKYQWEMKEGLDKNFREVGKRLASLGLQFYQHPDGGLLLVEDNRPRRITSSKELAPLLIDHIRITVTKDGKYHGERLAEATLNNMLWSRSFLKNFRRVEEVVTTPIALPDMTTSQPGFNSQGSILYLGPSVVLGNGIGVINKFLDVMEWQANADRTNAVAALLTVP